MLLQILFIRLNVNPINAEGFKQMISGDAVKESAEITKIYTLEFLSENTVINVFYNTRFKIYL